MSKFRLIQRGICDVWVSAGGLFDVYSRRLFFFFFGPLHLRAGGWSCDVTGPVLQSSSCTGVLGGIMGIMDCPGIRSQSAVCLFDQWAQLYFSVYDCFACYEAENVNPMTKHDGLCVSNCFQYKSESLTTEAQKSFQDERVIVSEHNTGVSSFLCLQIKVSWVTVSSTRYLEPWTNTELLLCGNGCFSCHFL